MKRRREVAYVQSMKSPVVCASPPCLQKIVSEAQKLSQHLVDLASLPFMQKPLKSELKILLNK